MNAQTLEETQVATTPAIPRAGFGKVVRSEWVKLWSVRSTWWTMIALVVVGAGLTTLLCWGNADWLASEDADEPPGAFITWGMMIAPVCAVIIGALSVTSEYGTGMIRTTLAATPDRGKVLVAKSLVVAGVMFVAGTATALLGYLGGNPFLENEGIGLALEGDVARAMYGSGLYMAGIALLSMAFGFIVRHTAAAISIVLALLFVVGNMVMLIPGELGEWITKVMPGNAGGEIAMADSFVPFMLDPWPGFGLFMAEVAVLMGLAWYLLRKRDA